MTFPLDADAETVDGWVAIDYKGTTGYVSAEYVTMELALGEAVTRVAACLFCNRKH